MGSYFKQNMSLVTQLTHTHTHMHACTHAHTHTHTHTHTALFVIYWRDMKLSAVILGVCLVVLLTLTLNTFLHTIVLLLLSFLVVSLSYIVTKVMIDSFYNREIKNPFRYRRHSLIPRLSPQK